MSFTYKEPVIFRKHCLRLLVAMILIGVSLTWTFVPAIQPSVGRYLTLPFGPILTEIFCGVLVVLGLGLFLSLLFSKGKYQSFRLGMIHLVIVQKNGETLRWSYEDLSVEYNQRTECIRFGLKEQIHSITLYPEEIHSLRTLRQLLIRKVYEAGGGLGPTALASIAELERNK